MQKYTQSLVTLYNSNVIKYFSIIHSVWRFCQFRYCSDILTMQIGKCENLTFSGKVAIWKKKKIDWGWDSPFVVDQHFVFFKMPYFLRVLLHLFECVAKKVVLSVWNVAIKNSVLNQKSKEIIQSRSRANTALYKT